MIYKHEDGTISTFYQKGETVEYPSDEEVIKYIDNAESWDAIDKEVYEELCKRLGIDNSEFDDPDNLFIEIQTQFIYNKCNLERWRRGEIREDFENGLTFEQVKLYAKPEYEYGQIINIRRGLENGLSMEQVQLYAKPEFEKWQMAQIRKGFENGLSDEQVKFYAKPECEYWQMEEIRVGFQNGLTFEQVELYAKPEFECLQMDRIRRELEDGLTFEEVMTKINNENKQDILHEKEKEKVISFSKDDEEIEFKEGEHTMINEKYGYEDFEKMVKLAALEDYKYSYNETRGVHQFTSGNNDECIEVNDYSTADGKPDNWDGDVHSDWNKICMELVEEFNGIVPGIHKKEEVWNLSDAESNEKSKGLNPIEKAEDMEF